MTVVTSTSSVVYRGNGATVNFPYSFRIPDPLFVKISIRNYATKEVIAVLNIGEYSITGTSWTNYNGGIVTYSPAISSVFEIVIERIVPVSQELDLNNQGGFFPESLEQALDKQTMIAQQLNTQLDDTTDRAIKVPLGETAGTLPRASLRTGNKILAFDSVTGALVVKSSENFKGDPGANAGNVGLLSAVPGMTIANEIKLITITGLTAVGDSGAGMDLVDDPTVDPAYVAANPTTSVRDALGRGFRAAMVREVYAEQYGYGPTRTNAQNLQALKDAIAATATGGRLHVGALGTTCVVDTSGGRSAAPVVNKEMTIVIHGKVQMSSGGISANPPCLFNVTAADVTFEGNGWLIGSGAVDASNNGNDSTMPTLIYGIGANRLSVRDIHIKDIPKIGIHLVNSSDWEVVNLRYRGGVPVAGRTSTDTGHYAIRATGGSGGRISTNRCLADPSTGAKYVNLFFGAGDNGAHSNTEIDSNRVEVWQKLAYTYGDNHNIHDNRIDNSLETDVIRLNGNYNNVKNNYGSAVLGVVTAYDGHSNTFEGNRFIGCTQTGINVQRLAVGYVGGFNRTRIIGNDLRANTATSGRGSGIGVYIEGANTADDLEIRGNTVVGFADLAGGAILIQGVSPAAPNRIVVNDNQLSNSNRGIVFERCLRYEASDNVFDSLTTFPIATNAGVTGTFKDNRGKGGIGNVGIQGFDVTVDTATGNRWTDAITETTLTIASGTNTISSATLAWIAPNARAYAYPINTQALGPAIVTQGLVNCTIAGQVVTVATPVGSLAAANQTYRIEVVQ